VNPFSISRPHHQWRIGRALFQHETLALVLFPTLGQTCDDLVGCVPKVTVDVASALFEIDQATKTPKNALRREDMPD
jgi:hypothetical protein